MSQEKTKLSRADRKQIEAAIAKAKNTDKRHKSAQDSIPFQRMFPDGICRVTDNYYSKTVQFQDINYQLNQNEDKTAIFDSWCDFLNYFDSSIHFQLSFVNLAANKDSYAQTIAIPPRADAFNQLRTEYTKMLQTQLARGNNGLVKTKFITFGVEAENLKTAKPRLERIEIDILNNFKRLGVQAEPLNGHDRLKLMHDVLHMDEQEPFRFSWDWLAPSGLSVKDFIAPSSFEFRTGSSFAVGKKYGRASFLQILAPELNDRMLADFLDMESSVIVSMHIQSVDQVKAIKTIKRKITDLDKMKIEEQKKAIRAGYDMDIIPSDLATYGNEAKKLLQELQSRNERMFLLTFIILNTAGSMQQLKNNVFQANSMAQKYNCQLTTLDFRQEEGLMSSLPLGLNEITIQRGLTTSSVAIFVPFTTQELFQTGKEALYCGINALSNNLIMVDRKLLKNPNGLILGTPGSGKSFSAKREIANVFLVTDDDIIICDPEAEYGPLVEHLHGQVIKISPTSTDYINPMDLNLNYSDDENPLSLKSDFILSLCELIVGGKDGLMPVEKTIIDRCVRLVYRNYLNDPRPENMPILGDLYYDYELEDWVTEEYEYEVEVPYTYYICTVKLENFNLSHVPVYIMSQEQLSLYAMYMGTLGNRPDLFGSSSYVGRYYGSEYPKYEIPPEALEDEQFAAIIKEAEKYLGFPYVWGGSSPSTSFDCSGFVSYVYNNCGLGWSFGRLGAEGLRQICAYVSPANAKPGDLIFFQGTYDTTGASHVGIYVGNNTMLHCGDPIQYSDITSSYWQQHFYQFGRLPSP